MKTSDLCRQWPTNIFGALCRVQPRTSRFVLSRRWQSTHETQSDSRDVILPGRRGFQDPPKPQHKERTRPQRIPKEPTISVPDYDAEFEDRLVTWDPSRVPSQFVKRDFRGRDPIFLRDCCTCSTCVDPSSRQKNFSTVDLSLIHI